MKAKHLFIGLLGLSLGLSSCNLDTDESDNSMSYTLPCCNLVAPDAGDAFMTNATYVLTFYYMSETLSVSTNNLSLGVGNTVGFTTNAMPYSTEIFNNNEGANIFSGGMANNNGVTVQNLSGFTSSSFNYISTDDPQHPDYKWTNFTPLVMSYTANHDYKVKTFMPDAIYDGTTTLTTVGAENAPLINDQSLYRVVFASDFKTADVIFYNAKFDPRMPMVKFIIQNLGVTVNKSGYVISMPKDSEIVPEVYAESGFTPFPAYKFTDFQFVNASDNLTTATLAYTIKGMDGTVYLGDFTGSYVRSTKK